MDLLQGYDSDSDNDSDASLQPTVSPAPASQKKDTNITKGSNTTNEPPLNKSESKAVRKGKRLLRLNAVLPPEILERLTRSTVQGIGSGTSDSESDSENDSDDNNKGKSQSSKGGNLLNTAKTQANAKQKRQTNNSAADDGINSFLSVLNGVSPTKNPKEHPRSSDTLGMAFMNVSTTVIRKKRNTDSQVVDIHSSNSGPSAIRKSIDTSATDNVSEEETEKEELSRTVISKPIQSAEVTKLSNAISTVPKPAPIRMGIRRVTNAAPNVSSLSSPPPSLYQHQPEPHHTSIYQSSAPIETPITAEQPKRKRSKREIEKALRSGNFDSISEYTQTIDVANHMQPSEQQILSSSGAGSGAGNSYRTSGLERYVPSEGMQVKQPGLSGKMKGKHQIHSLVSSAAKYEADQRRIAAMGMGKGKSSRADAKRKYGW